MTENDGRTRGNDHDYFDGLIGAYVIDSLDERERDLMDDYLADHPAQQNEVRRLTEAFDELIAAQGGGAGYPAYLWDRIEARLPDEGKAPTRQVNPLSPSTEGGDDLIARRAGRSGRIESSGRRLVFLAAAAVIVVMLAGLAVRQMANSSSVLPPTLSATDLPLEADRAAAQPGSRSGSLVGENGTDVRVVVESSGHTYVVPKRLAPVDQRHAYQLWSLDSGQPVSLGVMTGPATMDLPDGVRPSRLALSVEPASGSPQPTTTPVAAGALA